MKTLKIGVVIADDMEYAPLKNLGGQDCPYFFRDGHIFTYKTEEKEVIMHAVCSGIGKANAAAAAGPLALVASAGCLAVTGADASALTLTDCCAAGCGRKFVQFHVQHPP